ncbi:uncharacterized protein METZ01_LOCUS248410 [marine metagenome]|uniref:Uncharacterized protein n=1 Tax=marine metagenome TaxID=408172 RepID=A0A382I7G4_9ZZZZ
MIEINFHLDTKKLDVEPSEYRYLYVNI